MKTLAILLLGVVLASAEIRETAFRRNREYVYEYEGQLLTGIPKTSHEHSGLKIKCEASFQFKDDDKVVMKLDKISLFRLQQEVQDPRKQQPLDKFQEVTGDEGDVFHRELSKPVRFTYRQGKISDIETSSDEPLWSVNPKRAIMNLIQLNLNERESLDETKNINRPSSARDDREMTTLRVKEMGISGECESLYKIRFDKTDVRLRLTSSSEMESTDVMNITKIRDLQKCEDRRTMEKSILSGKLLRNDDDRQNDLIKSLSQVRYNVTGTQDRFMIESAIAEGQHILSLYKDDQSDVVTFVNQTLFLIKAGRIDREINMPADIKFQGSIKYEFPERKQLREKTMEQIESQQTSDLKRRESLEDVKTLLQYIAESIKTDLTSEETPSYLVVMVQKLRDLKKEDIEPLWQEVVERTRDTVNKDEERKRKVFMDALPLINTEESIKFIKEKIENRGIKDEMASQILATLAVIHDPTIKTLDDVLEMCKHPEVKSQKDVRKTCWLSFGSMVFNALSETKKSSKVMVQIEELKKELKEERRLPMTEERRRRIEQMEQRLTNAIDKVDSAKKRYRNNLVDGINPDKTREEQKMCLKAIGNAGLKDTVQDVQNIIESKTDDEMKVLAIYSLRRVVNLIPSKVRNILSPVYFEQENSPELRIAAFVVIMDGNVTIPVMQLFAQSLHKERSQQVGSYVYSFIKEISLSPNPIDRQKATAAKYAVRFAKPITPGAHYSKNVRISRQSEEWHMGFTTELNTVGTLESVLPRAANAKVSANILGYNMRFLETGFRAEGLQTVVDKIVGPKGSLWRKSSVFDLLKRKPRSVSTADKEKKELRDSLPIQTRKLEEPKGELYVKIFGHEIRGLSFDKDTVKSIIEEGKISIKDIEEKLKEKRSTELQKAIMLADSTYQIPSELGFPLQANVTSGAFVNMKIEGRAQVIDALFESDRPEQKPRALLAEADMLTRIAMNIEGKVGVDAHVLKTGVGVKASINSTVPMNGEIEFNMEQRTYKTLFKTLEKEQQLVSVKSKPFSWTLVGEKRAEHLRKKEVEEQGWARLWMRYNEPEPEPEKGEERRHIILGKLIKERPTEHKVKIGKEEVGVEFEVASKYISRENVPRAPRHPLAGPMEMNITVRPGDERPKEIEVEVTTKEEEKQQTVEHVERHIERHYISAEDEGWDWKSASFDKNMKSRKESRRVRDTYDQERTSLKEPLDRVVKTKKITTKITAKRDQQQTWQWLADVTLDIEEERYKSFHLEILKTPVEQQPDNFKMCMEGEVEYPKEEIDTMEKLFRWMEESRDRDEYSPSPRFSRARANGETRQIRAKLGTQWGKSCEDDKKVMIKTRVEKTPEQFKEETQKRIPEYEQCEKDRRMNKQYTPACMELLRKVTELRKVDIEITHDKLPKWIKKLYSTSMVMAQHYWWNNLKLDNVEIDNPYNKVLITAELSDKMAIANVTVKHPYENLKFERVNMPFKIQPMSTRKTMVQQYMDLIMNNQWTPYCKVKPNDEIRTFDNVTYKYGLSKCEHVIAEDCSEENRFIVLAAKTHHDTEKKATKVFLEDRKIEMIPNDDSNRIIVRVDGDQKDLKLNEKMIVRKNGEVEFKPIEETKGTLVERVSSSKEEDRKSKSKERAVMIEKSSEEEREKVSDVECEELQIKRETGREMTVREQRRDRACRCQEVTEKYNRGYYVSSREIEEYRRCQRDSYREDTSGQISSEEREYWDEFQRTVHRTVSENREYSSSEEQDRMNPIMAVVIRRQDEHIELISDNVGLRIKTDGRYIQVKLSQFYRMKHCGLCGKFDGERHNEFEGPHNEIYTDGQLFGLSYQVPSDKCSENVRCIPRMKTVVQERTIDGIQMSCFSKTPVSRCSDECRKDETKTERVRFHCLDSALQSTRDLVELSRTEIVNKIAKKRSDFTEVVEVHSKCSQ